MSNKPRIKFPQFSYIFREMKKRVSNEVIMSKSELIHSKLFTRVEIGL